MLDAREPLPVGAGRAGVRFHTDQLAVPNERHASAADQTSPELGQPRADRSPEGGSGCAHSGAAVWHPLHTHTVPA